MRFPRLLLPTLSLATALVSAPAPGQDAAPSYFAAPFPGWVQRVAAGADGSVYGAGTTWIDHLPGTVVPPIDPEVWTHAFVSAWAADGRLRWTTYLPFVASDGSPMTRAVAESPDGSVWVACCVYGGGYRNEDIGIAHVATDGSILFASQFGGSTLDRPAGLVVTADGDAIVAGTTWSPDFPTTLPSPWNGGESAAFVARVRSDGTGVAWSRLLDVAGHVRGTAVGPDGNGGVLAAVAVSPMPISYYSYDDLVAYAPLSDLAVARISADGAVVETTALPHGAGGAVFWLAECPDGSILASGRMTYTAPARSDAYVMRVRPETGNITALWKERTPWPLRIAVEPSGDVLVATDPRFFDPSYAHWSYPPAENTSRVLRLTPDLRETATLLDRDGMRSVEDVAVAPDGAVVIVGLGLSVTFNPTVPETDVYAPFVARVPPTGAAPASAVDVRRTTRRTAELSWTGGDPVAGYEVERLYGSAQRRDLRYEVVAQLSAGERGFVATGLTPGNSHHFRLVSVFPSGVRSATGTVVVRTKPAKVPSLRATWTTRGIVVRWPRRLHQSNVRLQIERRINQGPWSPIPGPPWRVGHRSNSPGQIVDASPTWGAASVAYRIRAELLEGSGESAWTYSNTVTFPQGFVGFDRRPARRSADAAR